MMSSAPFLLAFAIGTTAAVHFDVQPLAPAIDVVADGISPQMPDSRLVEISLDISTIVPSEFQGTFDEALIKITTRTSSVQVADYWPRTEMYSSITTPLSVEKDYARVQQASLQGAGGYPGIGSASGQAYLRDDLKAAISYQQQPPMHILIAAGTIDRRTGVYFKLRSSPQAALEGARSFKFVLEVPNCWRGDVLEFHAVAYGHKDAESSQVRKQLGEERFLIALYREQDAEAAAYAMTFVQQQAKLRDLALRFAPTIKKRAYPTPVHKIGQVLDIYEPAVPHDYLNQWIFGSSSNQPNAKLPVDLRVAMLDFIDSRTVIEALSGSSLPASQLAFANPSANQNRRR